MNISNVSHTDALQMSRIIQLLYLGNKLRGSLTSAGITYEGDCFTNQNQAVAWLEVLAKDMARSVPSQTKGVEAVDGLRRSSKVSPKTTKSKASKAKKGKSK